MDHRTTTPSLRRISLRAVGLLIAVAGIAGCTEKHDRLDPNGLHYENWSSEAEYVGRQACQTCHPDKYDSYIRSQMGRSWKKAALSLSDANFLDPAPIHAPDQNLYYQPFHRGEDLFVREYRVENGDTVHNRVEQIDYIVGSGQHTNSHIYSENGYLYQIPITWYAQDGHWDLAPGFRGLNGRFSRPIPDECMSCHNGRSPLVPGTENRFSSVAEGIGCEQCHGPGSVHIAAIKAGIAVDISRETDFTIVNPSKLPPQRELDLCARCHMQGVDVFRREVGPEDFRPGRALAAFQNVFWPRQPDSVEVFNMASHPDRLGMSRCFSASWTENGGMDPITCTTCHDPHVAIETKGPDYYAAICQSCHEAQQVAACADPDVAMHPENQNCASCHMPVSETDDIPHVRITDHFIRIPISNLPDSVYVTEDRQRILRMAGLINPNPTNSELALGFLNYYEKITGRPEMLDLAAEAIRQAQAEEPVEALVIPSIQLWYLAEDYAAIRRFAASDPDAVPADPWTQFRVGEAFSAAGDFARSVSHLSRAVALAPGHLRFMDRLASAYTRLGENEAAIALFNEVLTANSKFEPAINNRGFAHLSAGDFASAEKDFQTAIALNPDAEVALANLASIYLNTNRAEEARMIVDRLLILSPGNPQYQQLLEALRSGRTP